VFTLIAQRVKIAIIPILAALLWNTRPGQAARELGVSVSTVERTWAFARAWLFREIQNR
jgi:hypothetical protein